jgi:hypothetical protein
LLKGAAAVGLATVLDPLALAEVRPTSARRDLIRTANEKAGTTDWLLEHTRVDPKTKYRCPWIDHGEPAQPISWGRRLNRS